MAEEWLEILADRGKLRRNNARLPAPYCRYYGPYPHPHPRPITDTMTSVQSETIFCVGMNDYLTNWVLSTNFWCLRYVLAPTPFYDLAWGLPFRDMSRCLFTPRKTFKSRLTLPQTDVSKGERKQIVLQLKYKCTLETVVTPRRQMVLLGTELLLYKKNQGTISLCFPMCTP